MGAGSPGGSYVPTSDELAFKTLKDWFDAVKSLGGTADELYELLDDFAAWANTQNQTVKKIAWKYISDVRAGIESRRRERESKREKENKESKEGGKDSGSAGTGESEESPPSSGDAGAKPRPKGPGRVVWTSPEIFPYQTTPSKGFEGKEWVTGKKDKVYGIETKLTAKFEKGYKYKGSGGGWEKYGRPELKEAVDKFRAALIDVYGYDKDLPFDSCYRPLGTDVPDEKAVDGKGDPGGERDAGDARGHWTGESVDLHTKYVRHHFGIPDNKRNDYNFLDDIGKAVGLKRPWLSIKDGVHWTYCEPTRKTYPKTTIDGVKYGGQNTNP